ncbi:MAG: hypothetical protein K0U98_19920 [Deltaproteobacteria bacterium]|nr:hypothetical protein [Deltaproteobacteria bacterium]
MKTLALGGAPALAQLPLSRTEEAWNDTAAAFLDSESSERRALTPLLEAVCGLSPQGLEAGLGAILGGVQQIQAREIFRQAEEAPAGDSSPLLVILAGNLPALAVQPLLPALATGRPILLKSSSSEPFFAAAFAAALASREPLLGHAMAAMTWPGGQSSLEEVALEGCGKVIAYGEADTMADLRRRSKAPLVCLGPRLSIAVLGPGSDPKRVAPGLARDIALFDQRGCLSIQAIFTTGSATELAENLAKSLGEAARSWPPGAVSLTESASVRQVRTEAQMRGLICYHLDSREGSVIIEPEASLLPSPGLRTVRVYPLADLADLPSLLSPWRDRLQGVALSGEVSDGLKTTLTKLGVSHFAAPGKLQQPEASWRNGGLHPLEMVS